MTFTPEKKIAQPAMCVVLEMETRRSEREGGPMCRYSNSIKMLNMVMVVQKLEKTLYFRSKTRWYTFMNADALICRKKN